MEVIWSNRPVYARLDVGLDPAQGVQMDDLLPCLPKFERLRDDGFKGWGGFFMSPPTLWSDEDGMIVETAIRDAIGKN